MNFYENYYKTGQSIKNKAARAEFYMALLDYFYEGEVSEFKHESANIAYTAIFPSLDKQRKGRIKRLGRTAKQIKKQTISNEEVNDEQTGTNGEEVVSSKQEVVSISPNGDIPLNPPSFALLCLKAFNDIFSSTYSTLPRNAARTLERLADVYTVDEVKTMLVYMKDQWEGTKFATGLTPKKLFGSDDFETYMHQSKAHARKRDDNAIYD